MSALFGIDLGGTKIEGVVMADADFPEPLARIRIETEAYRGYAHILDRIALLVDRLANETGRKPASVGVGTPGSTNPVTGLLRNSNTVCLNGKPFQKDLERKLDMHVRIANDANCFALAEAKWGAARGLHTVFGVIMGTGVGGGLVVDGMALSGANGIAGEWGHNEFDPSGPKCYCGKKGCVETFLSGPANEREYFERTGEELSLQSISELALAGDLHASRQIELLCERFGRAISVVINIVDPEAVILGGGVGKVPDLRGKGRAETAKWVFSERFETAFLAPTLGDSAGVFGAALLAQ